MDYANDFVLFKMIVKIIKDVRFQQAKWIWYENALLEIRIDFHGKELAYKLIWSRTLKHLENSIA